jgi:hypothetical protein
LPTTSVHMCSVAQVSTQVAARGISRGHGPRAGTRSAGDDRPGDAWHPRLTGAEVEALQALAAGVHSTEHASGYALAYQRLGGDPGRTPFDPVLIDSLARSTVRAGAAVVPTLSVFDAYSEAVTDVSDLPIGERFDLLPAGMREFFEQGAARPHARGAGALPARISPCRGGRAARASLRPSDFMRTQLYLQSCWSDGLTDDALHRQRPELNEDAGVGAARDD